VQHAIEYEIERQAAILDSGGVIEQETRLYDADRGVTQAMRSKEEAHDYRYFPEPDLVPMRVDQPWVDRVRAGLPELPEAKRQRYIEAYGLPAYDAEVLTADRELATYFERAVALCNQPKVVSNWVMGDLLRELNRHHITPDQAPVTPVHLAGMLQLVHEGTISGKIAKTVFDEMYRSGKQAQDVVREQGLVQMNDSSELASLIQQVLESNPSQVEEYRSGKQKVFGFFVGQTMKATQGKANPKMVNELLRQMLNA
jgi:aspartyl-tRNA(Asn)/glutamyl-tRNA(Gln) amidotransferase subunit B